MKRIVLSLLSMTCGLAMLLTAGCASDDDANRPLAPKDDISGLPWNRPLSSEAGQRFGGFPQSH